ncbi:MAG: hypothetical protein N3A62_00120 [Thermodesulfovibrionales bacterium]|nr:hypothetical protein [Thermodesulfovibrionales bacterium]
MKKEKRFYPDYLSEIIFVVILCLEALLFLILFFPPQLGREIDFTRQYLPRPEWYFNWIFELLKYFPGEFTIFGAIIIPLFFALVVVFIPFLDKRIGLFWTRILAFSLLVVFIILTISGMV